MIKNLLLFLLGSVFFAGIAFAQSIPSQSPFFYDGSNNITQIVPNNPIKFSGLTPGGCLQLTSGNIATTTGSPCSTGSGTVTSVTGTYPIQSTGGNTPVISLAFGTTTNNIWAGLQTFTNPIVIGSLSGLLAGNNGTTYATATSTLSASSPLTGSFTQVGSGGSLGCQTASGAQAGCLSSADWSTFNGKGSANFSGTTGQVDYFSGTNTAVGTSSIFIAPSGNVGIGTTTPLANLSVQNNYGSTNTSLLTIASSTAPDGSTSSTFFTISNTGKATFNTNTLTTINGAASTGVGNLYYRGANGSAPAIFMDAFGAQNNIIYRRADGTSASTTALLSGDIIGQFGFRGYAASGYSSGNRANISGMTTGNWSDTSNPTAIAFLTTPVNGTAVVEAMRIDSTGNVGIGTTTPQAVLTTVAASSTLPTTAYTGVVSIIAGFENTVVKLFQEIDQWGHLITSGDTPTLSACGSSTISGNDRNGTITLTGVALTSCTMTFAHAYAAAPDPVVSDNTTASVADISSVSASAVTFGLSVGLSSGALYYQIEQHQ